MTPSDIYRSRTRKGVVAPDSFYRNPVSGIDYSPLNENNWPPSIQEIGEQQMACIREQMPISPELQKTADMLSKDMFVKLNDEGQMIALEEAIENIEKTLSYQIEGGAGNLLYNKNAAKSITSLVSYYENLKNNLQSLYIMISATGANIPGTQIAKELERIQIGFNAINAQLASFNDTGSGHLLPETVGFLKSAEWLGRRLKGKYLEIVGTEWIEKKVPDNMKVVNVGKVLGPTINILGEYTSSSKMLRTDIMGFDLSKNIEISFTTGTDKKLKTMNLSDFLNFIEKEGETTTISLDANNLKALQSALLFGVQAKAGKGQAVFNPKPVSLNEVIELNGNSTYANNLSLLTQLIIEDEFISPTHDSYQAMFNYCLSKGINNIIGKENSLVLTRQGITTMRDYLLNQWDTANKIVQAKNRVNIKNPDSGIPVYYSGANFLTSK